MIAELTSKRNLNLAYKQVYRNKGVGGVDEMGVAQLKAHLQTNGAKYIEQIRVGDYQPSPILGIEIPKSNGKTRLLGIPTVTDRMFQQAIHQVLQPIFEPDFQQYSYGFRPNRNAQQAVAQSLTNIN
jgi:RNA-directed DNA polymerase